MTTKLTDRDRYVLRTLKEHDGVGAARLGHFMGHGRKSTRYRTRNDTGVRNTLQRLERMGLVAQSPSFTAEKWRITPEGRTVLRG